MVSTKHPPKRQERNLKSKQTGQKLKPGNVWYVKRFCMCIRVLTSPFQPFQPAIKKPHLDQILAVRPSFVWDLEPHEHIPWPCTWMLDHRNSCLAAAWRSHSCHHTWRTKITHEPANHQSWAERTLSIYVAPSTSRERLSSFKHSTSRVN